MKVLIVNFTDNQGGAARAANRLHKSLLAQNIDSNMLVEFKFTNDPNVYGAKKWYGKAISKMKAIINNIPLWLNTSNLKRNFSSSFSPSINVIERINNMNPDIVHLHWINAGMINIDDLRRINAPIVWSLHDSWPYTGGCHFISDCENYKKSCGFCPVLESKDANDLSRKLWNRKNLSLKRIPNIRIIGLSKWIADEAKQSSLFKDEIIINLPNPLNTKIFKPIDNINSRLEWSLPKDKKLVLFGAIKADTDLRKGYIKLKESISLLQTDNIEIVLFGMTRPKIVHSSKFKIHYLGNIHDDHKLAKLYNAVDVMVVPSLQENLSNVIMESLSCGTPVVAFNTGGNGDMIDHKKNGYLAESYNSADMARGIEWIINSDKYDEIRTNARKKICNNFDSEIVSKQYIQLYKSILND